jgi:hypothetical protein
LELINKKKEQEKRLKEIRDRKEQEKNFKPRKLGKYKYVEHHQTK